MEDLINYINRGSCFVLIGAGASCEVGLPSWTQLANQIKNDLQKENLEITGFMNEHFAKSDFPKFFNEIWHEHGEKWLSDHIKKLLIDKNLNGKVYTFLSNSPFRSYFTTNYDDVLSRHLKIANKQHLVLSNSKEDLERFDPDTLTYIIKMHGDLDNTNSLILTEDQYFEFQHKGERQYYLNFLRSYFLTSKFFIIGYSINDPYIVDILKGITANFRRQVPIYAILSDVSHAQIKEYDNRCNIKVFSYNNKSGTHKELINILEALSKFIRTDQEDIVTRDEMDLKKAQSLYMWHRFQINSGDEKHDINSLKSVLLSIINDSFLKKDFSREEILKSLKDFLGVTTEPFNKILGNVLEELKQMGFLVTKESKNFRGTEKLYQYVKRYNHQYDDLLESYSQEVIAAFKKNIDGIETEHLEQSKKAAVDVIIDLFSERAIEIMKMIFEKKPIIIHQASNLYKLINIRAKDITSSQVRFYFIRYISDMLTNPSRIQENILEYFSKAYFSIEALQIDPIGEQFRKTFLDNRSIMVDSTVLIPMLATSCLDYEFFNSIIIACSENKINLVTTSGITDEVFYHADWAKKLILENGEQSIPVLSAAIGNYPYKRNAFLDGFIRYCSSVEHITFDDYLKIIFGKNLSNREVIIQCLKDKYNINQIEIDSFGKYSDDLKYEKEKVFDYIEQKADESNKVDKSSSRKKSEAEAFVIIRNWHLRYKEGINECSFLSQGGFLNKIAHECEFKIERNIVIRPDVLYEFLIRLSSRIKKHMSFKEVLISTYFRSTEYFIDKNKYQDFFSSLINSAEKAYKKGLNDFNKYIDNDLHTSSIDDYFELEKPLFVYSLEEGLKEKLKAKENEVSELKIVLNVKDFQLEETKKELTKLKQKNKNKKKYADRQRRAQAKRKGNRK